MGLLDIFSKPKNDPMAKYSANIYFLAEKGMDEIRKLAEIMADNLPGGRSNIAWFLVFEEFLNVYLHITEREAFSQVGNSGYPQIMNPLVLFSVDCSVELRLAEQLPPEKRQAIKKDWVQRLNATNQHYGRCKKLIAGSKEPPEGAVFGLFGVKVAELVGYPGNAICIDHCSDEAWRTGITLLAKDYVQEFVQNKAGFNLHVEKDSSDNIRRWHCGAKELARDLEYAKQHWNDKELRDAAVARARDLDQHFEREIRGDQNKK